jgi:RNA polymerase sigma-70 factor (ECF subfamily)
MMPGDPAVDGITPLAGFDTDSAAWVRSLTGDAGQREAALVRLHEMLLRIAHNELRRRSGQLRITGPELDDLAYQATADALLAIMAKVGRFRGESRFTTWAFKFVIFEVSAKVGRHFWANAPVPMAAEDWDRLPERFGLEPAREAEWRELASAVRRAVDEQLSPRQREVFVAIVLDGVPLDALAVRLGSTRNAIYKTMFDARRKLRASLAADGYLDDRTSRRS